MTQVLTSNQVTLIHGFPPNEKREASKIDRGFIVYLEVLGPSGGLFARTFWTKYGFDGAPVDQREFVKKILSLADTGGMKNIKLDDGPFTASEVHAFRDDISSIKFGWKPINVSYVLNTPYVKFQSVDTTKPLQQPIIFRRDKVVKGNVEEYLPNHSFFNLDSYAVGDATILEFSNFMLVDVLGTSIGEPPADESDMATKFYPFCLDIPMEFNQAKIFSDFLPMDGEPSEERARPDGGILNTITFVFDPPQGNGGGGGVPPQP
jgi:hypothetical protein